MTATTTATVKAALAEQAATRIENAKKYLAAAETAARGMSDALRITTEAYDEADMVSIELSHATRSLKDTDEGDEVETLRETIDRAYRMLDATEEAMRTGGGSYAIECADDLAGIIARGIR